MKWDEMGQMNLSPAEMQFPRLFMTIATLRSDQIPRYSCTSVTRWDHLEFPYGTAKGLKRYKS